jgi:predicted murein hydrolase (TIGR00659 family)
MTKLFMADSLFWLPATLGVYWLAGMLYRRTGKLSVVNPTLISILTIGSLLLITSIPYQSYFASVSILHYLLGTAVVALAIPLHRNLKQLHGDGRRLGAALIVGSSMSVVLGVMVAEALNAAPSIALSLAPKSATAAVSMEIARGIGGLPAITACLTIATGITGAMLGPIILSALGVTRPHARGLALGTVSHGIATARAFSENELTGCWATLAMCLNAVLTAILVPAFAAVF